MTYQQSQQSCCDNPKQGTKQCYEFVISAAAWGCELVASLLPNLGNVTGSAGASAGAGMGGSSAFAGLEMLRVLGARGGSNTAGLAAIVEACASAAVGATSVWAVRELSCSAADCAGTSADDILSAASIRCDAVLDGLGRVLSVPSCGSDAGAVAMARRADWGAEVTSSEAASRVVTAGVADDAAGGPAGDAIIEGRCKAGMCAAAH